MAGLVGVFYEPTVSRWFWSANASAAASSRHRGTHHILHYRPLSQHTLRSGASSWTKFNSTAAATDVPSYTLSSASASILIISRTRSSHIWTVSGLPCSGAAARTDDRTADSVRWTLWNIDVV